MPIRDLDIPAVTLPGSHASDKLCVMTLGNQDHFARLLPFL
jgi:hypothetical protein